MTEDYKINERGIITSPGMFEGERAEILEAWGMMLDGMTDPHGPEDDPVDVGQLESGEWFALSTCGNGFAYAQWFDSEADLIEWLGE